MRTNGGPGVCLAILLALIGTNIHGRQCLAKPLPPPATPPSHSTLILDQSNDIYGRTRTYINKTGLKIEMVNTNVVVLASAPTWRVVFYNTATKKGLALSKEEWLHHLQHTTYSGRDWDRTTLALDKPTNVARFGRKALHYNVTGNLVRGGITPNAKVQKTGYVELDSPLASQDAISIMRKCLSTPRSIGVPIEMVNHLPETKTVAFKSTASGDQTFLKTSKVEEKPVPTSFFDYPKEIIAEKSEADVMNDEQKQQRVNDAFNAFLH